MSATNRCARIALAAALTVCGFARAEPTAFLDWQTPPILVADALPRMVADSSSRYAPRISLVDLLHDACLLTFLGVAAYCAYLRRALRRFESGAAVPERVRTAFDTLVEGVVVLNPRGYVMLVNKAFQRLHGADDGRLIGQHISALACLMSALENDGRGRPWEVALKRREAQLGVPVRVIDALGQRRDVIMNCTPIHDGIGQAKGCLVTFSDVTELQERTERLRIAMGELHASREEIRVKNEELTLLATRDPLTGCLNRRAFTHEAGRCVDAALLLGAPLCFIMADVDHFKAINDRFGHSGGDDVLKAIAKALGRGLRSGDLLGRYGGEEFCIVLPETGISQALEIAERLRAEVESHAGTTVREHADLQVTMSFGVEEMQGGCADFASLVDLADLALYHSKRSGRNRVTAWRDVPVPATTTAETADAC